jgi:hypothetical protein
MQHADGELDGDSAARDSDDKAKVDAIGELGELVRGRLERAADDVADRKFAAMWRQIEGKLEKEVEEPSEHRSVWARIGGWFDRYRGHLLTGAVSAGAVAAVAIALRGGADDDAWQNDHRPISPQPVSVRPPPQIESVDTPGGTSMMLNLDDEDGHATVIWVTPADTVEGI